jgi:hypothetical protein
MEQFRFEEQLTISRETYLLLHGFARWNDWRQTVWIAVSLLLIAIQSTRWIGLIILVPLLMTLRYPLRYALQREYAGQRPHLHGPVVCGVSEEELWIVGDRAEVRFPWAQVTGWRRGAVWMWIAGSQGAVAYFRVTSLRAAGVYEPVVRAARARAAEGAPIGGSPDRCAL